MAWLALDTISNRYECFCVAFACALALSGGDDLSVSEASLFVRFLKPCTHCIGELGFLRASTRIRAIARFELRCYANTKWRPTVPAFRPILRHVLVLDLCALAIWLIAGRLRRRKFSFKFCIFFSERGNLPRGCVQLLAERFDLQLLLAE